MNLTAKQREVIERMAAGYVLVQSVVFGGVHLEPDPISPETANISVGVMDFLHLCSESLIEQDVQRRQEFVGQMFDGSCLRDPEQVDVYRLTELGQAAAKGEV